MSLVTKIVEFKEDKPSKKDYVSSWGLPVAKHMVQL